LAQTRPKAVDRREQGLPLIQVKGNINPAR
jgi:hypothetical protein